VFCGIELINPVSNPHHMFNNKIIFLTALSLMLLSSCDFFSIPEEEEMLEEAGITAMENLQVPASFNFESSHSIQLDIQARDGEGAPMRTIPLSIHLPIGQQLHTLVNGLTNASGQLSIEVPIDKNTEYLILKTPYPGFPPVQLIELNSNYISHEMKVGDAGFSEGWDENELIIPNSNNTIPLFASDRNLSFSYFGSYNSQGVPDYLEPVNDNVSQNILDLVANSLPEGQPVPNYNPQYIADGINANTELLDSAALWVTFVHEGAGYRNSLGYYTYPTNNPPSSPDDIDDLTILLPNVSYSGSGGGLQTGNKVYVGNFPAGTSIGWFLVPNGWSSSSQTVIENGDKPIKYSNKAFNTFTSPAYQSHVVLLQNSEEEILFLGFEDISRPGGDNDFNDAVFYITSNPFTAVNRTGLPETQDLAPDQDQDGISDTGDAFINDPAIAFVNYTPAEDQFGTLAFEDFWPKRGDYDLNDLVLGYHFTEFRNAANKVIKLRATLVLRAMGAGYRNGFGFEMNIPPSAIASVEGASISQNYINLASNGVEAGQSKAVIIAFDNANNLMSAPGGGFVNTEPGAAFVNPDTLQIDITLSNPLPSGQLGAAPYNPFLISGMRRGYEIHLPNYPPTDLADQGLFGTEHDTSNPAQGRYYKTSNNLPFALHLPTPFDYPVEKTPVNQAYLFFNNWATSGGSLSTDWFYDQSNYRNLQKIYQ
jgi:LruC domain-containing protein